MRHTNQRKWRILFALTPVPLGAAPEGRLRPGRETSLRVRIFTDDGVLVVYDAPPSGKARPYLAYWNDFASRKFHVYDRLVHDREELARVLSALRRDLQVREDTIVELSEKMGINPPTEDHARDSGVWAPAMREAIYALMGVEPFTAEGAVADVDCPSVPCDDDCLPPAAIVIDEPLSLPPFHASPRELLNLAAAAGGCGGGSTPPPPPPCSGLGCCAGDLDCDGIPDEDDSDIDGDGIPNDQDGDIDGDGISNGEDDDDDGDDDPDWDDPTPPCTGSCCDNPDPCCGNEDPCAAPPCGNPCDQECVVCDDGKECTTDSCDSTTGACSHSCPIGRYMDARVTLGEPNCGFPFSAEIKEITFLSDIMMYLDGPPAGWGTGVPYSEPDWKNTGDPPNPVCYRRSSTIRMRVTLRVKGDDLGTATLRVVGPDGVIGTKDVAVNCGDYNQSVTVLTTPLPSVVEAYEPAVLYWSIKRPGSTEFESLAVTQHDMYLIYSSPYGSKPTRKRLSLTCNAAAGIGSNLGVADKIHQLLNANPPNDGTDGTIVNHWYLMAGSASGVAYVGECHHQAHFMNLCLQLQGLSGYEYLTTASTDTDVINDFEATTASNLGITHDLDMDGQIGNETLVLLFDFAPPNNAINNFEGSLRVGTNWYAVWPSLRANSACELLRALGTSTPTHPIAAEQVWVFEPTISDIARGATFYVHRPAEPFPECP